MTMMEIFHKYRHVIVATASVAIIGGGVFYWRAHRQEQPVYREVVVARGNIEATILSTGVVQPKNRLEIKPPIAGRAETILVEEGQVVKKGQIMAWMSSTERAALIDAARAKGPEELKRWEDLYRATPVLAPIGGTVILRNIESGQTFTGNDAVFVMSDRLTVKAQVDETDIAQIRLHQSARIVLDAYPDKPLSGKVDQIAYDAKSINNVTTYEVEVLPEETPVFMRSGMTANVVFVAAARQNVLFVPGDSVKTREGHSYVLVPPVKIGGAPSEKEIRTGLTDGKRVEVLDGATEGEKLLAQRLRSGGSGDTTSSPFMPFGRKR